MTQYLKTFAILDPDWEDGKPVIIASTDVESAIRAFYDNTLLEPCPAFDISEFYNPSKTSFYVVTWDDETSYVYLH